MPPACPLQSETTHLWPGMPLAPLQHCVQPGPLPGPLGQLGLADTGPLVFRWPESLSGQLGLGQGRQGGLVEMVLWCVVGSSVCLAGCLHTMLRP